jgi:hypothetical protein
MNIPNDPSDLVQAMATDFPVILRGDLVGIYLRGSKMETNRRRDGARRNIVGSAES